MFYKPTPFRLNFVEVNLDFESWLISELSHKLSQELDRWTNENPEELPFGDMFKNDDKTTRVVIPFKTDPEAIAILNKIEKINHINFKTGTIEIPVSPSRQFGQHAAKPQEMRLGKYVLGKKSPLSEEEKNWWNHQDNPVANLETAKRNEDYAIIISRNPIDIARMSDHDGWTSCHATDREYFNCALADAKGAGGIAYVVHKADLKNIDLQEPEIFKDRQRGNDGITPISRLRLRKFVNKKEQYDLAIPEDRVYGKTIPGLEDSVRDWTFDAQQAKLKHKRPSMKEFELMGGSYQDTSGSNLFNNFFGDEEDYGNTTYAGGEEANMFDQYEEEVDQIEREFRDKFTICWFNASVEDGDGEPYVYYSGGVQFEIPEDLLIDNYPPHAPYSKDEDSDYQKRNKIDKALKTWANHNNVYDVQEVEIDGNEIRFNLDDNDGGNDPDAFRSFLETTLTDIEKNKDELLASLYHEFVLLGLAKENKVHYIAQNWDEHPHQFQNFVWGGEDPAILVSLAHPIDLGPIKETKAGYQHEYGYWQDQFKKMLLHELNVWANQILNRQNAQKSLFKDPEFRKRPKRAFTGEFKIDPIVKLDVNHTTQLNMIAKLAIEFEPLANDADTNDAIDFITFLDTKYDKFVLIVKQIYQKIQSQWGQKPV